MVSSTESLTIYTICSALSLAGSIFVCTSFMVIAELWGREPRGLKSITQMLNSLRRARLNRMVFFMSLSNGGLALKFFLTSLVAFISQLFGEASVFWYFFITLDTFVLLRNPLTKSRFDSSIPPVYHIVVWSYAALSSIVPLLLSEYGPAADGTCWIQGSHNPFRLLFYIPLTIFLVIGTVLLVFASCAMQNWYQIDTATRARANSGRNENGLEFNSDDDESAEPRPIEYIAPFSCKCKGGMLCRMVAFVGVFVLVWIWPCIFRWYQMAADLASSPPQLLVVLHEIGLSSAGFANCLVWITHPALMEMVFDRSCCFGSSFKGSPRSGSLSKRLEPGWIAPHQLDAVPTSDSQTPAQLVSREDDPMTHYLSLDSPDNHDACSLMKQSSPSSYEPSYEPRGHTVSEPRENL